MYNCTSTDLCTTKEEEGVEEEDMGEGSQSPVGATRSATSTKFGGFGSAGAAGAGLGG